MISEPCLQVLNIHRFWHSGGVGNLGAMGSCAVVFNTYSYLWDRVLHSPGGSGPGLPTQAGFRVEAPIPCGGTVCEWVLPCQGFQQEIPWTARSPGCFSQVGSRDCSCCCLWLFCSASESCWEWWSWVGRRELFPSSEFFIPFRRQESVFSHSGIHRAD